MPGLCASVHGDTGERDPAVFFLKKKKQIHYGRRDRGSTKMLRRSNGVKQTRHTTRLRGVRSPRRRRMIKCLFNNIKTYSKQKKKP